MFYQLSIRTGKYYAVTIRSTNDTNVFYSRKFDIFCGCLAVSSLNVTKNLQSTYTSSNYQVRVSDMRILVNKKTSSTEQDVITVSIHNWLTWTSDITYCYYDSL